jgi:uncharacterized protein YndB with AHSA1/START domain
MTTTDTTTTVQVYRVYIRATPQAIWDAITTAEWTERFGYGGAVEFDLRPGGSFRHFATAEMKEYGAPDVIIDGEVIEADPPRKLVQTWRMLMDPTMEQEGFTHLSYEIEPTDDDVTRLTVTHDISSAPELGNMVAGGRESEGAGGGWSWVLSSLKTLLETGAPLNR